MHGRALAAAVEAVIRRAAGPLLEAVGNPVAVNPDVSLARVARARRWPVEDWDAGKGAPKVMLPEAVR